MAELPVDFLERMKELLPEEEYTAFLESYDSSPRKGIRANPLKISREDLEKRLPQEFEAHEIAWCPTGLYIDSDSRPGKQPEYYTGLYYPQEPSAMIPAQAIQVEPGDIVLDLCAAPGGKSTQLAGKLQGHGTLILNEIVGKRVGVLAQNVERMGIENAVILNENSSRLKEIFPQKFDKILVDAPCSGEGMFRKDEKVIEEWDNNKPVACSITQKQILEDVDVMLKPGGELVYSTCTFAPEENEQVAEWLVDRGYELLPIEIEGIETNGRPEYTLEDLKDVEKTIRVWPHHSEGEGHFIARFRKSSEAPQIQARAKKKSKKKKQQVKNKIKKAGKKSLGEFLAFCNEYMPDFNTDHLYRIDNRIYKLPEDISEEELENLRVYTPGLLLGELKTNRFEPAQTLAMALSFSDFKNRYELSKDELWSYLKGEEIKPDREVDKGWILLGYEGYPVGFGKVSNNTIKNKYPKGLRIYKK